MKPYALFLSAGILASSSIGHAARIGSSRQQKNTPKSDGMISGKSYARDESESIVESNDRGNKHRKDISCQSDERVFNFRVATDAYGYENSFTLKSSSGKVVASEPSGGNWDDDTTYSYSYCVKAGEDYTLEFKDVYNDGICCEFGNGFYKFGIDEIGNQKHSDAGTHSIKVPEKSTNSEEAFGGRASGSDGCINIEILPDSHGEETSWEITDSQGKTVASAEAGTYTGSTKPISKQVCLPDGKYEWTIKDSYGDGILEDGYFKAFLGGLEAWRGKGFQGSKSYEFRIGYTPSMSSRDEKYLEAHNTRRQRYHTKFGSTYVPLKWSPTLADQAKTWANKLLSTCDETGIDHEKNISEGENLAKNVGSDDYMGQLYEPDLILNRWVDKEETWGWPGNAHFTQVLWRATRYVGCGESEMPFKNGTCRIQVCRYARAGNCAMGSYDASKGDNWKKGVLEDFTRCGPDCPPEGCF
mmetsp:Transcript_16934/g.35105  ORF Transcript_16934/g.35105 Transcript_16934/m.35105 type:complete len:471 (-) Transcript_16934:354-1766(-)